VIDDDGHDVTTRAAAMDGAYVDGFGLSPIRGYAASHTVTVSLGSTKPDLLLLSGWTDYAFSSDNVAASQAGQTMRPPSLEARTAEGKWRPIVGDIGIPVGRPQTIVVDLAPVLPAGATEIRLVTNMRIYWDQIQLADNAHGPLRIERLEPATATLRARGFSFEIAPGAPRPITYDYERVSRTSPWKTMAGAYTREGDVRMLLTAADDRFVVAAPGDEIALSFDAARLAPLGAGSSRGFLLYSDGFSKEMDVNSASPDTVEPLPFHGMLRYPFAASERGRESIRDQQYREAFNTRRIHRSIPPLR
jgi:hypothetical protein